MLINVNGKDFQFRYGWGAMYLWELACPGKTFNPKMHAHLHLMYFCMLKNANKDFAMTQDEFVEAMDTQVGLTRTMDEAYVEEMKAWAVAQGYATADDKKKETAGND